MIESRPNFLRERWPWLLFVAAWVALLDVELWTQPRFWAEEAVYYYERVVGGTWREALFGCPQGYYSLPCRLGALLASFVPVEDAPLVTTLLAFVFQVAPGFVTVRLAHRSGWPWWWTSFAVAAVVMAPPIHETWLTTTNSAFHLVLTGALVMLFHETLALRRFAWLVVFVAGACSGYAIGLAPIALGMLLLRPSRERLVLTAVLFFAIGLEGVAWLTAGATQERGFGAPPDVVLATFVTKCVVLPLGGNALADHVGAHLLWGIVQHTFWWWTPLLVAPFALAWFVVLRSRDLAAITAFASGHALAATGVLFGLGDKYGMVGGEPFGRYFHPATSLHALAMVLVLRSAASAKWARVVAGCFVAAAIAQGAWQYCHRPAFYTDGPDWRAEVAAWRQDPSRPLAVWPTSERWRIHLPAR